MKRVSVNSHQSQPVDEEARSKFRHQSLLQDYLERQKEFVSKKKKLEATKQKRDILLAEIGFLRRRHKHLLKLKSAETEPKVVQNQNSNVQPKHYARKRKSDASGVGLNEPSEGLQEGAARRGEEIVWEPMRVEKKPKNCLINDKIVGKKKIEQDQVAMNV